MARAAVAGPKVGVSHDFKVLLVLLGGPTGQVIDQSPTCWDPLILCRLKAIERKSDVSRLFGGGNKRPHGEYVDQLVIELLAGEGVSALALFATNRL
jgi:hypothetical protein